jgi:hypothetical protein
MSLLQLLGCENILVFVVEQMKTENLMQGIWGRGLPILGHEFHYEWKDPILIK